MRKEAFKLLHDIEDSWWYQGRKNVVGKVLEKFLSKGERENKREVLDFGAGFGGMLEELNKYGRVSAFEPDIEAKHACENRGYHKVFIERNYALSRVNNFRLVALLDVVEHVEDDKNLVESLYEVLPEGGRVIVTVPAYQWLWSSHDVEHHHYRRYTRERMEKLLTSYGFEVEYGSYWNMLLFIPAAIVRLFGFGGGDSLKMSPWLNALFYKVVSLETLFIPFLSLPFGTGIVVIARKK